MIQRLRQICYGGPYDLVLINHYKKSFIVVEDLSEDDKEELEFLGDIYPYILDSQLHRDNVAEVADTLIENEYAQKCDLKDFGGY